MRWAFVRAIGLLALLAITDVSAKPQPSTQITIWAAPVPFGGLTYGAGTAPGAMIFEQREVDVGANGEMRVTNIAGTADPISMQLRDLTDPGAAITEQRFIPAPKTATELISRRIGEQVVVVTPKGEVAGVLRAVDDRNIVIETGSGDARRVSVMRRDYAVDVRLPGAVSDKPGVAWKLATSKRGKHSIELTYRADGLTWSPAYVAILDEPGKLIDFTARGTIKNTTGATFDNAIITLMSGSASLPTKSTPPPARFALPHAVKLTADSVQLELLRVAGAKARSVVAYEAMVDPSGEAKEAPATDCLLNNGSDVGVGTAESTLEIDVPNSSALPDGRVQLFRRRGPRLDMVSEDQLRSSAGVVRMKVGTEDHISGERKALTCTVDERTHTIREKIEVKVDNTGTQPLDVIAREFLWRWAVWRVEGETKKGVRAGPQTMEFRLRINAKSSQTFSYTAVYTW